MRHTIFRVVVVAVVATDTFGVGGM